jgi:ubiquitin-protein ligase
LLPGCEILSFVSSLSVATRVNLDFGTEAVEKTSMNRGNERAVLQAAGHLCGMRKYLALLCALSGDDRIAACLGGNAVASSDCKLFVTNLSNMIIQFLEKLTSSDGGTNPSLEDGDMEPTSSVLANMKDLAPEEKKRLAEDVVHRRIRAKTDFGLDISLVCHQLLALAARWHLAVATNAEAARSSPFLSIMASNDDCDVERLTNVFRRLVSIPEHFEGSELDNAIAIFMHDGHVDHSAWAHKYEANESSEDQKRNRRTARQFQTKHEEIARVASNDDIMSFIDDLSREVSRSRDGQRRAFSHSETAAAERSILTRSADLSEEDYSRHLSSEWIVSSSPFTSSIDEDRLLHSYDKTARNRGIQAPVRLLVKEARICRRTMPSPSANSAIYVCFAEERMDLCRVVMSGPVETPYTHGLYEFDVYFPPTYPQVPPLVTFMTTGKSKGLIRRLDVYSSESSSSFFVVNTGGGRVRFNPNLYVDGKVCISLLHNTTTSDESQRWNPKSSLAQLMISIQSQILGVKEPYFNEGNGTSVALLLENVH